MTLFHFITKWILVTLSLSPFSYLSVLWAYSQQPGMSDPGTKVHRFLLLTLQNILLPHFSQWSFKLFHKPCVTGSYSKKLYRGCISNHQFLLGSYPLSHIPLNTQVQSCITVCRWPVHKMKQKIETGQKSNSPFKIYVYNTTQESLYGFMTFHFPLACKIKREVLF